MPPFKLRNDSTGKVAGKAYTISKYKVVAKQF